MSEVRYWSSVRVVFTAVAVVAVLVVALAAWQWNDTRQVEKAEDRIACARPGADC